LSASTAAASAKPSGADRSPPSAGFCQSRHNATAALEMGMLIGVTATSGSFCITGVYQAKKPSPSAPAKAGWASSGRGATSPAGP
jgi:hypothetical protein